MWNENFQFEVCVPDLALVRFLIEDYDSTSGNEFIGQYTLPFNSLRNGECANHCICINHIEYIISLLRDLMTCFTTGYHHVPLLNKAGDLLSSAGLFVHIMVVDSE